jgi:predicted nucleic acid-binding protein
MMPTTPPAPPTPPTPLPTQAPPPLLPSAQSGTRPKVVVDTNIVLDLLLFNAPAVAALHQALRDQSLHWITTEAMREELERVLHYPKIVARLHATPAHPSAASAGPSPAPSHHADSNANHNTAHVNAVLAQFDALTTRLAAAPKAHSVCKDRDDQKFIDLAVQHQALLLSKDKAVLCMAKRLQAWGVRVLPSFAAS